MSDSQISFDEAKLTKYQELQEAGLPMYPARFEREVTLAEVRERYAEIGHDPSEEEVTTAGRIYSVRRHGKTIFVDVGDESTRLQLYVRKDDIGDEPFDAFKKFVDTGDIVGVTGRVFRTKMGEITIWVSTYQLLTKSVCAMPEKFHGLKNTEMRYRHRYLDLIMNAETRETFRLRSRAIAELRTFLNSRDFLEFETPTVQPVYGGANARPFMTYHNALEQKLFLRIAPELYLKRLVVGGFEKVYEIAKNFRNEDIDTHHNPEFSMVEIYAAYHDYHDMMNLTEEIITHLVIGTLGTSTVTFEGNEISFERPWRRLTMEDAVREYGGIDVFATPVEELAAIAEKEKMEKYEAAETHGDYLALFFEHFCEDKLIQPTFIYDFPIENSPLAKRHRSKPGFTERFELFVNGMELANGFSELNDPLDQKERFEAQDLKRRLGDLEAQMIDYDFINALGYGMPPTGGVGIGIDRTIMLITGNDSIKEVILFPSMRRLSQNDDGEGDDPAEEEQE
ncbi:lysine--tRNA ligase [Methanofollis aquaemaris]|uniref:Lysine--tRNA ligase n=1 Tax=Methanofollis aquaemaris TaxID=126734 RepID=A0A8A3S7A6_9EURY|nr:lysine--tRNA ligase [Methanofollis aquaemaris]QSZ68018.1 lysine--tRNA ligase [Methanofollis aquaemaris]